MICDVMYMDVAAAVLCTKETTAKCCLRIRQFNSYYSLLLKGLITVMLKGSLTQTNRGAIFFFHAQETKPGITTIN